MTIDCVLLSLMVSGVPPCGVELNTEEVKFEWGFVRIATFDVTILIARDKKFTVPALIRNHARGWTFDTWLRFRLPDNFHSSGMIHGWLCSNGWMVSLSGYSPRPRSLQSL